MSRVSPQSPPSNESIPANINLLGLTGPAKALALSILVRYTDDAFVILCENNDIARKFDQELRFFIHNQHQLTPILRKRIFPELPLSTPNDIHSDDILRFPDYATPPYTEMAIHTPVIHERLKVLAQLRQTQQMPRVLTTTQLGLLTKIIPPEDLDQHVRRLSVNSDIDREDLITQLLTTGYERASLVEEVGTFAIRGSLVDIFPPTAPYPVRIEFFGDTVESIRYFDPDDQQTFTDRPDLKTIDLLPTHDILYDTSDLKLIHHRIMNRSKIIGISKSDRRTYVDEINRHVNFIGRHLIYSTIHGSLGSLLDYLPSADFRMVYLSPFSIDHAIERLFESYAHAIAKPILVDTVSDLFLDRDTWHRSITSRPSIWFDALAPTDTTPLHTMRWDTTGHHQLREKVKTTHSTSSPLVTHIKALIDRGLSVWMVSQDNAQNERIMMAFRGDSVATGHNDTSHGDTLQFFVGPLQRGFTSESLGISIIVLAEIYGMKVQRVSGSKQVRRRFLDKLQEFGEGDYLVHGEHGIGIFRGLKRFAPASGDEPNEFLLIEYKGGNLFVPVHNAGMLTKYIAVDGAKPHLDLLGGKTFAVKKRKVKAAVQKIAEELVALYAKRSVTKGISYTIDQQLYDTFSETFPFQETEDQRQAIADCINDMRASRPMDRLVCGDVGFGKTEVALRAAFVAVMNGMQAAILVPTTVLAMQHHQNVTRRFADFPISVGILSRFQSRKEIQTTLSGIKAGTVDLVIGTHRMLSKDVVFKNLGLFIVDEEQRFGVSHKEKIKQLRTNVDVLTLTATPIPRTLQMSMFGIRDLSIIETPPTNRIAIETQVARFSDQIIFNAIQNEQYRGGQIYFVHNRVESIHSIGAYLKKLVPQTRIGIAHGKMNERDLEDVMIRFINGDFDLLLCTKIIESGLDIPNVNTIIINRADQFGLAELYQLRGRVGRSTQNAYAYLLVPDERHLSQEAEKRLQVLRRFTDLGSGFKIAAYDLEIRGGGNLLGESQSGHVSAVGLDMYAKILEDAVQSIRGESVDSFEPELKINFPCYIPKNYIGDSTVRMLMYRRLSNVTHLDELDRTRAEMQNRFGVIPDSVQTLCAMMAIRCQMVANRIPFLEIFDGALTFKLSEHSDISHAAIFAIIDALSQDGHTVNLTPEHHLVVTLAMKGQTKHPIDPQTIRSATVKMAKKILHHLSNSS